MKKCLLVYSMHVLLWAPVPMAAAVNTPSCLIACFIHVLRSPGHVATQPPCASCNFIPGQTWLTKLLLQSWLIDRECWLFLPTTILQSHKKINSREFSVILSGRGVTHFGSLPLEWKFSGFVLKADPLSAAPEVALGFSGDFYMNSTSGILVCWIKALH